MAPASILRAGWDFAAVVLGSFRAGFEHHGGYYTVSLATGLVFAIACWIGTAYYARLWHRRFYLHWKHHALCAASALITFCATVTYTGLEYLGEYGRVRVATWSERLLGDKNWTDATFAEAYDDVAALGIEDFSKYPRPPAGHRIPATNIRSIEAGAARYAGNAVANFSVFSPWLALTLQPSTLNPRDSMRVDVANSFRVNPDTSYEVRRGVALVTRLISADLISKTPRLVTVGRALLLAIVLCAQAATLLLIGYAAFSALQPRS